jgi:hypothetical protein
MVVTVATMAGNALIRGCDKKERCVIPMKPRVLKSRVRSVRLSDETWRQFHIGAKNHGLALHEYLQFLLVLDRKITADTPQEMVSPFTSMQGAQRSD